ncbi:WXG100 family type VII secretion target [Amycolatopsis nigrescens]|uniref:WXG100 family type VII secretion target n=1 Tax=Amycolatopsis nigrescens TaxID=381445 RepID=UPI00036A8743|nr:type VII secretion target [Amycolatopsis nigrescens]
MTMPNSYTVDPEQLREHAGRLAGYADQLGAIGTGLPDTMGEQSLGSFAQFITTGLGGAMTEALGAFAHAASTVDQVSDGMRRAADDYQRTEDGTASGVTGIGATMEEDIL